METTEALKELKENLFDVCMQHNKGGTYFWRDIKDKGGIGVVSRTLMLALGADENQDE